MTGRLPHAPRAADRDERVLAADGVELVHMGLGAAALRQRLADAPHGASPRDAAAAALLRARGSSTSCTCTRPTTRASSCSRRSRSPPGRSASAPTTPSSRRARCSTSCTRPRAPRSAGCDGHVVVSEACIEPLDHYFPEFTWRIIPNGIDEDHFSPERRADRASCARAASRSSSSSAASIRATASGPCSRRSTSCGARATAACACASSATGRCGATTPAGSRPRWRPPCTGPGASTGTVRATTPRPTSSARPASARASAWCCSRP